MKLRLPANRSSQRFEQVVERAEPEPEHPGQSAIVLGEASLNVDANESRERVPDANVRCGVERRVGAVQRNPKRLQASQLLGMQPKIDIRPAGVMDEDQVDARSRGCLDRVE